MACHANDLSCNILRFTKNNKKKCFLGKIQNLPSKDADADAVEVISNFFKMKEKAGAFNLSPPKNSLPFWDSLLILGG